MQLDDWLTSVFGRKTFIVAAAACVVLTMLFNNWGSVKLAGVEAIDANFGHSPRDVIAAVGEYRARAAGVYPRFFLLDLIFPAAYALALSLALAFVLRRALPPESAARELSLLPCLAALADYAENFSVLALYLKLPEASAEAAKSAAVLSWANSVAVSNAAKWLLLYVSLLLLVAGLLVLLVKGVRRGARA